SIITSSIWVVALRCRINEEISTFEAGFFMITASYILNIECRNGLCNTRVHSKVFFKHES
ncbi:unnamed protein product, partial [Larinioides sclopetarius]